MTQRKLEYWVIPPKADAEFVAHMESVLDTYALPYDPQVPVLCMDEQPMQLLKETRTPIAATKDHPKRVDYEYERAGTANVFLFCEPLAGWRQATVREQRTKVDWAREVAALLKTRYKDATKVILVCDNLNTHTMGAFYEAFPADEARELVKRVEFRHTPNHGSWLNIAENELFAVDDATAVLTHSPIAGNNHSYPGRVRPCIRPSAATSHAVVPSAPTARAAWRALRAARPP